MTGVLALIKRTVAVGKKTLFAYVLIAAFLVWMFVVFFPSINAQAEEFGKLIENYPEAFLKAFGVETENLFLQLESFLAAEHYSMMWPLLLLVLVITQASAAVAGEIEKGTIGVLLAQPLSRTKVYWAKFAAGFLIVLLFVFASNFVVVPLARIYNLEINLKSYWMISVLGALFGLAVFGLTMMFSALSSTRGRAASLSAGILILMYALNLFASLKESAENLKYFSFFYYYDYSNALLKSKIEPRNIVVFLTTGLIFALFGAFVFSRRDLKQ